MSSILDTTENLKTSIKRGNLVSKNQPSQTDELESLGDYLNVGIIFFDASYRCAQINSKASELLEQTSRDILDLSLEKFLNVFFVSPVTDGLIYVIEKNRHEIKTWNSLSLAISKESSVSVFVDLSLKPVEDEQGRFVGVVVTIVEVTHHQDKIRELEKDKGLLVGILDNTTNVVYAKNLEGKNILINTQYERIFNLKKEDVVGKLGCADFLPPEIVELVRVNDMKVIQSGEVINFEEEILHDDGIHSYLSTKFPLNDVNGTIIGVGGISTDITEFKYSEKLNESLNHILSFIHTPNDFHSIMQKILDESSMAIGADSAGITILEDNVWIMRYGYGEIQNWVGSSFSYEELSLSILAAETKTIIAIDDCLNDPRTDSSVIRNYGVKSCLIFPLITRGEVLGVLQYNYIDPKKFTQKEIDYINKLGSSVSLALDNAFYRDNLEKLVEQRTKELRSSEQRFAKAFNSNPNLMTISTLKDGKYIEVNESFLNVTGFKLEEVLGKSAIQLKLLTSKDRRLITQLIKEKGEVTNHELKFRTKDGQIKDGLLSVGVIDLNGEKCLLSVTKDITERNRLVREISRLDQLSLIGEMAAGIGHEIRNPMTTARGFLQMLGTKSDCENYKEYFDLIIEELDRANSIITEYLSMAKDKAVELKVHNLNSIITVISTLIKADAIVSDKHLKLDLKDIPQLLIDEKEIRQLIFNLSRNGFEAMEPGGELTISTYLEGMYVVLAVRDNGQGIEPKVMEKLGTPFFTTKDNGTGLGLAVCYSVAARHRAKINIESGPKGSTFFVKFPLINN